MPIAEGKRDKARGRPFEINYPGDGDQPCAYQIAARLMISVCPTFTGRCDKFVPRVIVDFDGSLFAALSSARFVDVFARNKISCMSHFRAAAPRRDATKRGRKAGVDDLKKKSSGTAASGEKSYRRFTTGRPARKRAPFRVRNTWLLLKLEILIATFFSKLHVFKLQQIYFLYLVKRFLIFPCFAR